MEVDLEKVYEDKGIHRAILDFKVHCNNKSGGCQWVGELRHLKGHLGTSCENAVPRLLMKRIEICEAAMKAKDEEIVQLKDIVKGLYAHMMNVDEYIPNVRTVFTWKLNITSYEAPLYSPKFYSRLKGHYCMLRVAFISVPNKSGAKSVRFGIYFHIVKGVNGEECGEAFNMKINIEVRNKHGKMDTFQFTKEDVQKQNEKPKEKKKADAADAAPKPAPKTTTSAGSGGGDKPTPAVESATSEGEGDVVENEGEEEGDETAMMPDLSKFVINDCLTIKCTLLHNQ